MPFPGQYFNQKSGLHCTWNWYYDLRMARYITIEPTGLEAGLNTYAYVLGSPLNRIDPFGLFCTFEIVKHGYSGSDSTIDYGVDGPPTLFRTLLPFRARSISSS